MIPDGVHFGLDEEAYHADPALGSGDHKAILINPVQWRFAKSPELREALGLGDSAATLKERERMGVKAAGRAFGTAVDLLVTQPDRFVSTYVEEPDQPEGLLFTKEQIREALGPLCTLPRTAATSDYEALARMYGIGPLGSDWPAMKAELCEGKTTLSRRWMATLRLIDRLLDTPRNDYGGQSIRQAVLANGQSQVSVFWTDPDGVRCKCRFDYLRIKAVIDVKTFAAAEGVEIVEAFWNAISRFAYDMQAAHYLEGRAAIHDLVAQGRVFGDHDPDWIARVAAYRDAPQWSWVTIQTVGMPEVDLMNFGADQIAAAAAEQVKLARAKYREHMDRFGPDAPWVSLRGPITLGDMSAPNPIRVMGRGAERWR
jgi:hypothetical protein